MLKKLLSHSFLYAVGPQVPKLANFLVLPIVTQYLTAVDYGIYGTLLAYSGLLGGIKSLGFDVLLVNSFFKKTAWKTYWGVYLGGLLLFNCIFGLAFFLILYYIMPDEVGDNRLNVVLLIVVPSLLFDHIKKFGGRYYQLLQKPKFIAITTAISGVVVILLNLYTIAYLGLGYLGWFISSAAGSLLVFGFYSYTLFNTAKIRPLFTSSLKFWKRSLKISLPTVPHQYSSYLLNSSDRLVMDRMHVPIDEIGTYNLAYIFGGYMEMFGQAINMAVAPMITSLYSKKTKIAEKQVQQFIFFLMACFILILSTIALWTKELFQLLIRNDSLLDAYPIAIIIIMSYSYRPLKIGGMNKLFFYEHTNKLWRISFIAGMLNVVLNIIFIPLFGIYVAAITTFISMVYFAISPYYIKEYRAMENERFYAEYWMIGVILLTGLIYMLRDISITYKVGISLFFLFIFLLYFKKSKEDLSKINIG